MKTDGLFLILVKRPDDTNWTLDSGPDGMEYAKAAECLSDRVGWYGKNQVIMAKVVYFATEVTATPIGMVD